MELNELKLIAIHIQKTGGMAFKKLLRKEYKRKYYRLNIGLDSENRKRDFQEHLAKIPPETQVIHGHFVYEDVAELIKERPRLPVVTWLRQPVDRVVSSYYFMKRKFDEGLRENKPSLEYATLLEFASEEININQMSRVLKGADLRDFAFVGCLEFLAQDLSFMAALLGWKQREMPKRNVNREYKEKFSLPNEAELLEIARLNMEDIELYEAAMALRREKLA